MNNPNGRPTQVNIRLNVEEIDVLDALVAEDTQLTGVTMDRSKTVKRLVRQETDRRNKQKMVVVDFPAPEGAEAPVLIGVRPEKE
jgi:hypothetical protein